MAKSELRKCLDYLERARISLIKSNTDGIDMGFIEKTNLEIIAIIQRVWPKWQR